MTASHTAEQNRKEEVVHKDCRPLYSLLSPPPNRFAAVVGKVIVESTSCTRGSEYRDSVGIAR